MRSPSAATLALLQRDLIERRGWLRSYDVSEALAYTKPLPGSTVVQVVTFLGWRLGGWPGALIATVIFLLPALTIPSPTGLRKRPAIGRDAVSGFRSFTAAEIRTRHPIA